MSAINKELQKIYFPVEKLNASSLFPDYRFPRGKDTIIYNPDEKRILNVCSKDYSLVSNQSLFAPIYENLVTRFGTSMIDVSVKTVDSKKFYVTMVLNNQPYQIQPGDIVKPTIELANSYDGTLKFSFSIGFYRVICSNGMMGFEKQAMQQQKHFNGQADLTKLFSMLDDVDAQLGRFKKLAERRLTSLEIEELTLQINEKTSYPPSLIKEVPEVLSKEREILNVEPTSWLLYHAFNNRLNHADIKMHREFRARIDHDVLQIVESLN